MNHILEVSNSSCRPSRDTEVIGLVADILSVGVEREVKSHPHRLCETRQEDCTTWHQEILNGVKPDSFYKLVMLLLSFVK